METNELTDLEQAEKDLRFYAAIIGHRPMMDTAVSARTTEVQSPEPLIYHPSPEPQPLPSSSDKPNVLKIWVRDLSHRARKRLDEAYHRLAS